MIILKKLFIETRLEAGRHFRSKAKKQGGPRQHSGVTMDSMYQIQEVWIRQYVHVLVTICVCLSVDWGIKVRGKSPGLLLNL